MENKKRKRPGEYFREWRRKNPQKAAAIQTRYWLKRSAKLQAEAEAEG